MNTSIDLYSDDEYDYREIPDRLMGVRYATVRRLGNRAVMDVRHEAYECAARAKYCGGRGGTYRTHRLFYNVVNLADGKVTKVGYATLEEHGFDQSVSVIDSRDCDFSYPNLKEAISAIADHFLDQTIEKLPEAPLPEPPQHQLKNGKHAAAFEAEEEV